MGLPPVAAAKCLSPQLHNRVIVMDDLLRGTRNNGKITSGRCSRRRTHAAAPHAPGHEPGEAGDGRRADLPADPEIRAWLQSYRLEPPLRIRQGARCTGLLFIRRDAVECAVRPADVGPWAQGRLR